jgi:hypothetical protein
VSRDDAMNALAVTAATNFVLACEAFFLAGLLMRGRGARFSAAWFWAGMMFLLGVSALLGGIDHGFFESAGLPRHQLQRANWLVIGAVAFLVLLTAAAQFFAPRARRVLLGIGVVQFILYAAGILAAGTFTLVILNYVPVLLLLLVMNTARIKRGLGSWPMINGIILLFVASGIQALHIDVLGRLDASGLYHLVTMLALLFLYRGGLRLRTVV